MEITAGAHAGHPHEPSDEQVDAGTVAEMFRRENP